MRWSDRAPPAYREAPGPGGKPGATDSAKVSGGGGRGDRAGPGAGRRGGIGVHAPLRPVRPGRKGSSFHRGRSTPRGGAYPPRSGFPSRSGRADRDVPPEPAGRRLHRSIPSRPGPEVLPVSRAGSTSPGKGGVPVHPADERPPGEGGGVPEGGGRMLRSRRAGAGRGAGGGPIAGVSAVYRVGGAQAIAALAFGTRSIPASR